MMRRQTLTLALLLGALALASCGGNTSKPAAHTTRRLPTAMQEPFVNACVSSHETEGGGEASKLQHAATCFNLYAKWQERMTASQQTAQETRGEAAIPANIEAELWPSAEAEGEKTVEAEKQKELAEATARCDGDRACDQTETERLGAG
jgi:hypothetical protein